MEREVKRRKGLEDDGEVAQATADDAGLIIYAFRIGRHLHVCPVCCRSDINAPSSSNTRASCLSCGWCLPHYPRPRSRILARAADYPKSLSRIFGLRLAATAALPRLGVAGAWCSNGSLLRLRGRGLQSLTVGVCSVFVKDRTGRCGKYKDRRQQQQQKSKNKR